MVAFNTIWFSKNGLLWFLFDFSASDQRCPYSSHMNRELKSPSNIFLRGILRLLHFQPLWESEIHFFFKFDYWKPAYLKSYMYRYMHGRFQVSTYWTTCFYQNICILNSPSRVNLCTLVFTEKVKQPGEATKSKIPSTVEGISASSVSLSHLNKR